MSYPLLIAMLVAPVQRSDSQTPPRTIPELESRIRAVLERTHTPGVSVAVVSRDSVVWQAGLGWADVASGRDATAETLFRIGSTSKTFTALMVLLLEQEGRLHLEDPIQPLIPEIAFINPWEATDPVRLVNVLEHTAGWDDWSLRVFANSDPAPLTLRQGLDLDPRGRTSRWRPGTRFSYTNWGPPVAAYIVEKVTNRPFDELVHDRLFVPIGMRTATLRQPGPELPTATLYHRDGRTPFPYWHVAGRPTGAINASATDMAAYLRFLINRGAVGGRQLLPAAAMARLELPTSSLTARAGLSVGYGLFLMTYATGGFVWSGHTGEVPGGLTTLAYRPDAGIGYAFSINSNKWAAVREIDALIRGYLTAGAARLTPPPTTAMSSLARAYSGWYVADNPRMQRFYFLERMQGLVRARIDDSGVTLDPVFEPALRYVPVSATLFRRLEEPVATLALVNDSANGRPASLEIAGFAGPLSFRRISPATAYLTLGLGGAFGLTTLASLLFGLGLIVVAVLRKRPDNAQVWLAVWPLLSALAVIACYWIVTASREDAIARFGAATTWSIGLFVCITLFAVASVLGLVVVARSRHAMRGPARVHAILAGVINVSVVAYLAWWGVLGWRIWG